MIQDRDLAAPGTDRMPQGAMHIVGGGFAGGVQGLTSAQIRRDRRRERAAGTMPLDIDSLVSELETPAGIAITIDHCARGAQVTALEQHSLSAGRSARFRARAKSRSARFRARAKIGRGGRRAPLLG